MQKSPQDVITSTQFSSVDEINPHFHKHLEKLKFTNMTKIQEQAFKPIIQGQDTILKSQTGSGKTLAYLVPLLNHLIKKEVKIQRSQGCYFMILTPTRELSLQIMKILEKITKGCIWIVPGILVGGEETKKEKARIRKGLNIIVGTPGRILYHLQNTMNLTMNNLEGIIFEEADQILDLGFEQEIKSILDIINQQAVNYQNILVSASITGKLEMLLKNLIQSKVYEMDDEEEQIQEALQYTQDNNQQLQQLLDNFQLVGFGDNIKKFTVPKQLNHFYVVLDERKKTSFFLTLLKIIQNEKIIVFMSTADQVNYFTDLCQNFKEPTYEFSKVRTRDNYFNVPIHKIHGHMEHKERSRCFLEFNEEKKGILFCTDIASRGLDFSSLSMIVLFDVSPNYKAYVNRVGRTARIENIGSAVSLLYEQEIEYAKKLTDNCNAKEIKMNQVEQIYLEEEFENKKKQKNFGQFLDIQIGQRVNYDRNIKYLARRAFNSFCRAYSLLKDEDCFNLKKLNLHRISKSYGLKSSLSTKKEMQSKDYTDLKDAKQISKSEQNYLNMKKQKTLTGMDIMKKQEFVNDEFKS